MTNMFAKFALIGAVLASTLSFVLPSQAASNQFYPQDRTWDVTDQGPNGGGGGGGGGGD